MAPMRKRGYSPVCLAAPICVALLAMPAAASPGTLSPSPSGLEFGSTVVGTGIGKSVAFTDSGTATTVGAATLEAEEPPGQFEIAAVGSDCQGAVLEDTESCTLAIVFHPTAGGEMKATLALAGDASNSPVLVPLEGVGVPPALSIGPSPFDFGSVVLGSKSSQQTFSVEDTGSSAATIGAIALSGADAGEFQIGADGCSSAGLAPGEKCDVGIVFAPTSVGAKSAALTVPSDGPESPSTVPVTGTGAPAPAPSGRVAAPAAPPAPAKPSNRFSFGKVILNRGRGTASLSIRVPGPGLVVLGGKGILARRGPGAAVVLGGAGVARLAIAAAGQRRAALYRTGAAKVVADVTYTPSGGDPLTKTRPIGLRKRRCGAAARCRRGPAARRPGSGP